MKDKLQIKQRFQKAFEGRLAPAAKGFRICFSNAVVNLALLALVVNSVIESLSRQSVMGFWDFMTDNPRVFFYNTLIILATLSLSLLIKRRFFLAFLISAVWLGLGIANGVILGFRTTPFTVADLSVLDTGLGVIPNYLSNGEIILVVAALIAALGICVALFLFAPQAKKYKPLRSLLVVVLLAASVAGSTQLGLSQNWLSTIFGNLGFAYQDYGFPYCFVNTWLNVGVSQPKNYSQETMAGILESIEKAQTAEVGGLLAPDQKTPNIVIVQLESFFDPSLVAGLEMSEDPIPNFHALQESYSSGYLAVPSIGAGTANTELEVLSGMRIRFFGPGEYPYKTILTDNTVETLCFNLKELGYGTHALHNHRGAFYGRNFVFSNLGFDTFTSLEYMLNAEMNPRNWAKDFVLTEEILNALDSTEQQDFVYAISVQAHGKYPMKKVYNAPKITVEGIRDESEKIMYEYYINQIHEVDQFVGELVEALSQYEEDTVLVLFGDHLPALGLGDDDVANGNIFETEYVIWSNFRMRKQDKDLYAYQLGATLLGRLGINNGVLTKFHQTQQGKGTYLTDLKALQHDILYGKKYIYGGETPYEPTELKMGIKDIVVTDTPEILGHKYVKGENFTKYSVVTIDGKFVDTVFLDSSTLRVPDGTALPAPEDVVITQIDKNNTVLSTNME